MIPSGAKLVFKDLPQDDPRCRKPDISLAKSKLGWQPHIKLTEGLQRSIPYFAQRLRDDGVQLKAVF